MCRAHREREVMSGGHTSYIRLHGRGDTSDEPEGQNFTGGEGVRTTCFRRKSYTRRVGWGRGIIHMKGESGLKSE